MNNKKNKNKKSKEKTEINLKKEVTWERKH